MSNFIKIIESKIYENKNNKNKNNKKVDKKIENYYENWINDKGSQKVSKFEGFISFLYIWLFAGLISFNIHKSLFTNFLYFLGYSDWRGTTIENFASHLTFYYFLVVFMLFSFVWFFIFFLKYRELSSELRWIIFGLFSFIPFFFLPIFIILFIPLLIACVYWFSNFVSKLIGKRKGDP